MKHFAKMARSSIVLNRFTLREGARRFEITRHIVPRSGHTVLPGPLPYSDSGAIGHDLFSGCAKTHG